MIDVEPIIERELNEIVPIPVATPDWAEVERRAALLRPRRARRSIAFSIVGLAAALLLFVLLFAGSANQSIVGRAYAAVSGRVGVMHFVVTYAGSHAGSAVPRHFYEEYWIDLAHPSRERIVQSHLGKVDHQLVFIGGYRRVFGYSGRNHNPITIVTYATPPEPPQSGADPSPRGVNPILGYRQVLRSGRLISQGEISYRGKPAYKLVILREEGPPNLVYASERITYIVDRRSYFPVEWAALYRAYGEFPGLVVTRYLRFEILPATPKSEALLKPAAEPQPYRP